ncbi:hypothetical protein Tco_1367428 [Tanacetum coccineum]
MTKGSTTRRPRGSCFFGCFGCSDDYIEPLDEVNPESPRRRRWFSKLKFSFKKSDVKTVPVEISKGPRKSLMGGRCHLTIQPTPVANTAHDAGLKSDEQNTNSKKITDSIKGSCPSRRKETKAASAAGLDSPKKKNVTITQPNASSTLKPRPKVKKQPLTMAEKRRLESGDDVDLESIEYKKKVVMEGLLKRNHRNIVGRSTRL